MTDASNSGPTGLGGWLVLVAIGLFLSSLLFLASLTKTFAPIFLDGDWAILTTPGSDAYNAWWAPLLVFELIVNIGLVVAKLWLLVLFFKRARHFPSLYVWVTLLYPAFVLVDAWLLSFLITDESMIDLAVGKELARSSAHAAIWIPYMFVSKRVRNTFVA